MASGSCPESMGTNTANLHSSRGRDIAGVYGGVADTYSQEAARRAGILGQIGQAQAGGIMGAANAQGGLLNSVLGGVGQLAKLPLSGGGSLGGSLVNRLFT